MTEQRELDSLRAVLAALPPSSPGWTDELWDLYEAYETSRSKGRRLPEVPAGQVARFEAMWERGQLSDSAHKLLRNLRERVEGGGLADPVAAAGVAVRLVRSHVASHDAVYLLHTLEVPHGERGLLDLVTDRSINEGARLWACERLFALRRAGYEARGRLAPDGEEPLFPDIVRQLPAYTAGVVDPLLGPVPARAALEALLPPTALLVPEPPPPWTAGWDELDENDEFRPDWLQVRWLVRELMPTPKSVTRERMAEAEKECGALGLDGLDGGEGDFATLWTTRIGAWLVEEIFEGLTRLRDVMDLDPRFMDLAEEYVRRGMAVEAARAFMLASEL